MNLCGGDVVARRPPAVVSAVSRIPRARRDEADRRRASAAQIRVLYKELCGLDMKRRQKIGGD